MNEKIRLQKYFTDCGILSRRAAEAEILAGNVRVNGNTAQLGDKVDPHDDIVEWNGKQVRSKAQKSHIYIMLNKPRGYVTTSKDEKGRKTVLELTKDIPTRIYPVGRLDMDSEGLLLLTDDGDFANALTHPRHQIPKIYRVTVFPIPTAEQIAALSRPMTLDGYQLQPVGVKPTTHGELEMRLYEGRNRQIRKMCASVGLEVKRLRRIAIGNVRLGELPTGAWRYLSVKETQYLIENETKQR